MALTGRQKHALRGLAHHLNPVVHVGTAGITRAVVAKIEEELENHELIKVKVLENAPISAKEAAPVLAEASHSECAQRIGRIVVLYKKRAEEPEIQLPEEEE